MKRNQEQTEMADLKKYTKDPGKWQLPECKQPEGDGVKNEIKREGIPHLAENSREELPSISSFACVLSIIQNQFSYEFVLSMNCEEHLYQCRDILTALAPFWGQFLLL